MTVRFQRRAETTSPMAVAIAQEFAEYINGKYPETLQVFTERFGTLNVVYWITDFPDVATLDTRLTELAADEGYQAIIIKALEADAFVPGSIQDTVLSTEPGG